MACLARNHDARPGEAFADWLLRHKQNVRTINLFWATVLVSALNERLERMDHGHARRVFVDGFLLNRSGFQMEIPTAPLGELYGSRLEGWLRDHGVEVRLTTGARGVDCGDDATLQGVTLRTGETIPADFVVLAVSYDRVAGMFSEATRSKMPALAGLRCLESSPITGVHLWFDRPVCPFDHVVTPGRFIHWVFNHTAIQGRGGTTPGGADEGQYLQIVISAAYDLLAMDRTAIRKAVLADLADMWPAVREAKLTRWWVVTEHGATFAARPGVDAYRPAQRTPIDGLFLAGDYTDTGWPATMEGAVRSGYLAAQGILEDLDRPARLIRPDLKASPLANWLVAGTKPPAAPSAPTRFVPRLDA
jgi:squalene-associated FAD-dependent desaturase